MIFLCLLLGNKEFNQISSIFQDYRVYICQGGLIFSLKSIRRKSYFCSINSIFLLSFRKTYLKLLPRTQCNFWNLLCSFLSLQNRKLFRSVKLCVLHVSFICCMHQGNTGFGKMDCRVRQPGYYFPPIQANAFLHKTNTFCNLNKYNFQYEQMHFVSGTNIF